MNQTMVLIVGAFFGVLFFGLVMMTVFEKKDASEERVFTTIQNTWNGTQLIISWEANVPSDGTLHYWHNGTEGVMSDHTFDILHKITLDAMIPGTTYYIEACDLTGTCFHSELVNAS
jgi:hypothetical protein